MIVAEKKMGFSWSLRRQQQQEQQQHWMIYQLARKAIEIATLNM